MTKSSLLIPLFCAGLLSAQAADYTVHSFKKIKITDQFWGEGASFADFNKDGHMDIVSGPYWWVGPDFKTKHAYYPDKQTFKTKGADGAEKTIPGYEGALGKNNAYSENFLAFTYDFNSDGWPDIFIAGFPGKESYWYENPWGQTGASWARHVGHHITDIESPGFADITGDGKPELICGSEGYLGYASPDWKEPRKQWTFHRITPKGDWQRFTHGLGFGDVNGDGRQDMLEKDGWWEQPASLEGDPVWTKHPFTFGVGGAQMYAYDVDGDGDNDVITSLSAHGYGLAWYENVKEDGKIAFKERIIMNGEPKDNKYGVKFSQLHAIDLVDMDGDGLKDIVTGKRFWAHGPTGDAEPGAPAVLYWFKLTRGQDKSVDFIPYQIDDDSGIGTQVLAGLVNKDNLPDVVVGNKKGTFVFLQEAKKVSKKDWEAAQPKPLR